MKIVDQQLQFDMKSQMKLINFNNVKVVVVNFQNIKKNCLRNIIIILTSSIKLKSISSLSINKTIIK